MDKLVFTQNIKFGADPELFIEKDSCIVGSERAISDKGIGDSYGKTVRDGVQVEIHPKPEMCRALFTNNLSACFKSLIRGLKAKDPGMSLNFSSVIKLSKKELDTLSEQSKVFGCAPSSNIYNSEESKIKVNPKRYLKRSAGGHIHLSSAYNGTYYPNEHQKLTEMLRTPKKIIPLLDAFVGNTSVLLDRNPANAERRKVYGKAGEHRIKPYGCEYRTLSNFWLKHTALTSFVLGMSRFACNVAGQEIEDNNNKCYSKNLFSLVKQDNIFRAIQENNFDLAMENFSKMENFILDICGDGNNPRYYYPINNTTIKPFKHFVNKGMDYWFTESPIYHWTVAYTDGHDKGIESFLTKTVTEDLISNKPKLPEKTIKEIWVG